jgi:hypothetical protein
MKHFLCYLALVLTARITCAQNLQDILKEQLIKEKENLDRVIREGDARAKQEAARRAENERLYAQGIIEAKKNFALRAREVLSDSTILTCGPTNLSRRGDIDRGLTLRFKEGLVWKSYYQGPPPGVGWLPEYSNDLSLFLNYYIYHLNHSKFLPEDGARYFYNKNLNIITWKKESFQRGYGIEEFEFNSKNNILFYGVPLNTNPNWSTNAADPTIFKVQCNLIYGKLINIQTSAIKSNEIPIINSGDDYRLLREKLISSGWRYIKYMVKDQEMLNLVNQINPYLGIFDFNQCFSRGGSLYSCDTQWTSSGNNENPELSFDVTIDLKKRTATVLESTIRK